MIGPAFEFGRVEPQARKILLLPEHIYFSSYAFKTSRESIIPLICTIIVECIYFEFFFC
jgi:hypothetical protein